MSNAKTQQAASDLPLDPRKALYFLWRHWKFIVFVTAAVTAGAAFWLLSVRPRYVATTQILIDPHTEKEASADAVNADRMAAVQMDNQIAIVRSTPLLRRVVEEEELVNDPEFGAPFHDAPASHADRSTIFRRPTRAFGSSTTESEETVADAMRREAHLSLTENIPRSVMYSINVLRSAVIAKRVDQADVLGVSVSSLDPDRSARIANAIARAYLVDPLFARYDAAQLASVWLSERLAGLRERLRKSEQAVVAFRAQHNLVQGSQNNTLTQDQLTQLNGKLVAARADAAEKKSKVDLLQKIYASGGTIQALPDVMNAGLLGGLRAQRSEISRREADLVARYTPRHPLVVNVRAERADVERAIATESRKVEQNIRNDYLLAVSKLATVEKSFREATGQAKLDNETEITLRELERGALVNKSLFEAFLQRASVAQEHATFEERIGRIIVPALASETTSTPKKNLILGAAVALGLALGLAGAWLLEKMNSKFTSARQVEELIGAPVLAQIRRIDKGEKGALKLLHHARIKQHPRSGEALRALQSGIQLADVDNPPKLIQVASASDGEGKTAISVVLASTAAASGAKTLIVDCDFRLRTLSLALNAGDRPGLSEYLAEDVKLDDLLYFDEMLGVWLLPAGKIEASASAHSGRLAQALAHFKANFDYVVFDTAAAAYSSEARLIAHLVDKILFIIKWDSTPRDSVTHALRQIGGRTKLAGFVLNFVDAPNARRHGESALSIS